MEFDSIIDRRGSGALKTDALRERFGRDDLIPLWVADMDFESPSFVREAVMREAANPVLGYAVEHPEWRHAIIDWQRRRHGWDINPEWISFIPGIVKGIALAVCFLTEPGDKVIIQPPVYHPFRFVTVDNGRVCVENPLIQNPDGTFGMDFDNLEKAAPGARLLILSNPHNPGGKVWSPETLRRLADICARHGITVISDEIHCDLTLPGHVHTPFATVSPEAARISITFGSPSKAFNIPGLASSWTVVPDDALRHRFFSRLEATELCAPCLGQQAAAAAAYLHGDKWLAEMLSYIEGNIDFIVSYIDAHIPGVKAVRPQASYLVWLDCRGLGLDHDALQSLFIDKARLALNDGEMFGAQGHGFMRLNAGSPRSVIQTALGRLAKAVKSLNVNNQNVVPCLRHVSTPTS